MISPARGNIINCKSIFKRSEFQPDCSIFRCEHTEEGSFGFVLNKKFPETS